VCEESSIHPSPKISFITLHDPSSIPSHSTPKP
jgi:hypothetical protein